MTIDLWSQLRYDSFNPVHVKQTIFKYGIIAQMFIDFRYFTYRGRKVQKLRQKLYVQSTDVKLTCCQYLDHFTPERQPATFTFFWARVLYTYQRAIKALLLRCYYWNTYLSQNWFIPGCGWLMCLLAIGINNNLNLTFVDFKRKI